MGPGLVRKQDVAKGGGLELKVNVFKNMCKMLLWRRGEETNITQTYHRRGSGADSPVARGCWQFFENFCIFLEKKQLFECHLDHILQVFKAI